MSAASFRETDLRRDFTGRKEARTETRTSLSRDTRISQWEGNNDARELVPNTRRKPWPAPR